RYRRDVWREQNLWNLPERARRRQGLAAKDVEDRAAQATIAKAFDEGVVVQHRSARDIDDNRGARQQVEPRRREQSGRLVSERRGENDDVVRRQLVVELVESNDAGKPRRSAETTG